MTTPTRDRKTGRFTGSIGAGKTKTPKTARPTPNQVVEPTKRTCEIIWEKELPENFHPEDYIGRPLAHFSTFQEALATPSGLGNHLWGDLQIKIATIAANTEDPNIVKAILPAVAKNHTLTEGMHQAAYFGTFWNPKFANGEWTPTQVSGWLITTHELKGTGTYESRMPVINYGPLSVEALERLALSPTTNPETIKRSAPLPEHVKEIGSPVNQYGKESLLKRSNLSLHLQKRLVELEPTAAAALANNRNTTPEVLLLCFAKKTAVFTFGILRRTDITDEMWSLLAQNENGEVRRMIAAYDKIPEQYRIIAGLGS